MNDQSTVVALREFLRTIVANQPSLVDGVQQEQLRERVCAVVDELRDAGWPPERVIVAIKQIASDAGLHPSRTILSATSPLDAGDSVLVQMVRWCIGRYFSADAIPS